MYIYIYMFYVCIYTCITCMYVCIYIYICQFYVRVYIYIYIYTYICNVFEGPDPDTMLQSFQLNTHTVSFHNFKSQNFKLSVSNPKSKYVAHLSVLSQISNCQGLGRKNKHEILKTGRMI